METISIVQLILGSIFIILGLIVFAMEIYGIFRMKYVLNRMHAAAMGDSLGLSLCIIGFMIYSGFNFTSVKMLLIVLFLWFSSPASSHVIAALQVKTDKKLEKNCAVNIEVSDLEKEE